MNVLFVLRADKTVREVKERLLVAKGNPSLDKVMDVNVLCGVLKDFFIKLREPLLTFKMHGTFVNAAGKNCVQYSG